MNRQIALLTLVTATLAACADVPRQHAKPAPVIDLPGGPAVNTPQTNRAPAAESNAVVSPTTPGGGAYLAGDGPGANAPTNLDDIPDAVPKAEPLHRYANRPYSALGKTYTPLETPGNYKETGIASWYGKKFHGQRTSIGEVYDMYGMSAAHPILPIPSYARITNLANKKSVIVRVNDRGPFLHDRIIDLSYTAAHKLGIINNGSAEVQVESIASDGTEPLVVSTVDSAPIKSVPLAAVVEATPPIVIVPEIAAPASAVVPATASVEKAKPVVAAGNIYLQLGAFKSAEGASSFLAKMRSKLGDEGKSLSLYRKEGLERIHLGPYATQEEARSAGEKLKAQLGFKPFVSVR